MNYKDRRQWETSGQEDIVETRRAVRERNNVTRRLTRPGTTLKAAFFEKLSKAKPLDLSRRIPKKRQHIGSCKKRNIRNFLLRFYLGMKQKAVPWNVVDEDKLAVFPCQLVCESNSAEFEVFAIGKYCLLHL